MSPGERRRLLLVTYQFPPVGGAGVQRVAKFARYLPEFGWDVTVLTAENPSVPASDPSLDRPLPPGSRAVRARTLEPSYQVKSAMIAKASGPSRPRPLVGGLKGAARSLANALLQPDPQVLWRPGALRAGRRALREAPHHAVLASAPPYSVFGTAGRLAKGAGLPLVLDYRDEWELANKHWENRRPGPLVDRLHRAMEDRLLRRAALVLATSPGSARRLAERVAAAGGRAPSVSLPNGWDAEDFPEAARPPVANDRAKVVYVGTLWALTDVSPVVEGARRAPEGPDLVFVGRRTAEQDRALDRLPRPAQRLGYLPHAEALALAKGADALLVLLSDGEGAERVVPAKLFEAMAAKRPVLAVMPEGDAWGLLDGHPRAWRARPDDPGAVARALQEIAGAPRPVPDCEFDASRYERRAQARELAELLDRAR